jgi:Hsp20/alpha crystallin family
MCSPSLAGSVGVSQSHVSSHRRHSNGSAPGPPRRGEQHLGREPVRHHSSRRTGRFEFRTYLPGEVNADAVTARLSDGVLTVTVPKSEVAKPRKVEITG